MVVTVSVIVVYILDGRTNAHMLVGIRSFLGYAKICQAFLIILQGTQRIG